MRHPRIIISGIGLAVVAAVGGVTAASAASSAAGGAHRAGQNATTTVRTASAAVAGKTETILVNVQGLPLYYYRPDTATKSFVTGGLARLWPPLTSAGTTAAGMSGKLTVLNDTNGRLVAYNSHLLYTFIGDHAGQVTGQGVQGFFVATPGLTPIAGSSAAAAPAPAAPSGSGYGY